MYTISGPALPDEIDIGSRDGTKIGGAMFLAVGMLFTGSFLLFQMKRHEILRQYYRLRAELGSWE